MIEEAEQLSRPKKTGRRKRRFRRHRPSFVLRPPRDGVVMTKENADTDIDISTSISNNTSNRRYTS